MMISRKRKHSRELVTLSQLALETIFVEATILDYRSCILKDLNFLTLFRRQRLRQIQLRLYHHYVIKHVDKQPK